MIRCDAPRKEQQRQAPPAAAHLIQHDPCCVCLARCSHSFCTAGLVLFFAHHRRRRAARRAARLVMKCAHERAAGVAAATNTARPASSALSPPSFSAKLPLPTDGPAWRQDPPQGAQGPLYSALNRPELLERGGLVVVVGPAGTGKTHMAVQAGAAALLSGAVRRLVVTRPVATVGQEDLGFLPGGVDSKMAPFLMPVIDELRKIWVRPPASSALVAFVATARPMRDSSMFAQRIRRHNSLRLQRCQHKESASALMSLSMVLSATFGCRRRTRWTSC